MTEQSESVSPKSSETDPPAANQPTGDDAAADATPSADSPAGTDTPQPAPEIPPGKPDGEVDTRS